MTTFRWIALFALTLSAGALGCGRSAFTAPTVVTNPPPQVRLGEYEGLTIQAMEIAPEVLEEEDADECERVAQRITELFGGKIEYLVNTWKNDPQRPPTKGVLVLRPTITQLKWVTRGERIWAGAMYGNSAIVVEMQFIDPADGSVVANPVLLARANAMGGAWGMQDDAMLTRISEMMANYIIQNHPSPIGGPTGVE